ncbi:bifunctional acetate--CoA ligase family protein/GNAT family N-acetyltransferase [Nakamurella endophytica]|uniref:N-acetyltransferase domain-containing protein n=1 Tax=Nakamurella endophytica TaxID=1748367 RepID=A0A917T615_9ACTN|nr:bifunctional GNAT family N-acetyltransferase/acetate--CoA ligase family protein [Nakamurella endophytica]GGM11698.1 hypothetical protein GCM10011594_34540 [Nakamurella endophytica]
MTERPYPQHWEADVVLTDGGVVHVRPIGAEDGPAILDMHRRMSDRTRYLRYFSATPVIGPAQLRVFTEVDHHDAIGLVAELGGQVIAAGTCHRDDRDPVSAEVAFVVEDAQQRRGLGSILLEHLAAAAAEVGIRRFTAEVLAENQQMVRVFADAGYAVHRRYESGVVDVTFDIAPTARSREVLAGREHRAEARSLARLLAPRSIAVIGALAEVGKVGHAVLENLLRAGFTGPVYPVNPDARSVQGVRAYARVTDIPDPVDVAVVTVPAGTVAEVVQGCRAKQVHGLVVVTSGFADAGGNGAEAQRHLVAVARGSGMRVLGPNCLGMVNTDPAVRLNATLAPVVPGPGRVGFFSQSGALGIAILADAARRGLGLSSFVSAGNRADVSGNDLLQYWYSDDRTEVVLLYLESFGNPRKFARLARVLARTKPVIAVKSGRHALVPAGLAASSAPLSNTSVAALFAQSGVIRTDTLGDAFDVTQLLSTQPVPQGDRIAILGNSTALGILAVDACLDAGLRVVDGEPRDLGVDVTAAELGVAVHATVRRDDVDAVVVVFVPPVAVDGRDHATALKVAAQGAAVPVLSTFLAVTGLADALQVADGQGGAARGSVPSYATPERAVAALAHAVRYGEWLRRPPGAPVRPSGIDAAAARTLVDGWRAAPGGAGSGAGSGAGIDAGIDGSTESAGSAKSTGRAGSTDSGAGTGTGSTDGTGSGAGIGSGASTGSTSPVTGPRAVQDLTDAQLVALLGCYGVTLLPFRTVPGADEAVAAAGELGLPVAVKAFDESLRHRMDQAGVRLHLATEDDIRRAVGELAAVGSSRVYVQQMAPADRSTVPTVFQVTADPSFGALVSFGVGGVATDLLDDRAYRIVPLTDVDAAELVRGPRAAPLLEGYRNAPPVDLAALADVALRLSCLADDVPELLYLQLQPVLAGPAGVAVTGAVGRLGEASPAVDDRRRLR